jgi:two-component system sensor histidine kinase PilS (NtrC family)
LPAPSNNENLRLRLTWVTVFRAVATTLMLAAIGVRLLAPPAPPELSREDAASLFIVGAAYVATLVYAALIRLGRVGRVLAYVQIFGDVVISTAVVYLTGGAESPFAFAYLLAIGVGSIILYQPGAFLGATLSAVAFAALTLGVHYEVIHGPSGTERMAGSRLAFILASNVLAQYLIAALAGYLSQQLSVAGGKLFKREKDLRELATLQRQILACMPSGLVSCEGDGSIIFMNRAASAMLGVDDWSSRKIEDLIPGLGRLNLGSRREELEVQTPLGRRTLGLSLMPLEGADGSFIVVFQDLSDLRRAEAELHRVDRLAALGTMAAQLAHEIRNPLAAMRGSAQMLAAATNQEGGSTRLANILIRESDRLSSLVENVLRFARPPPPVLKRQSLRQIVVNTLEVLNADPMSRGVTMTTHLAEVSANVDADQLSQALINILRNAIAAAGPQGEVRVSVDAGPPGPRVRIWDSGGSIPRADQGRIFEPFFTTREGGTGLGLSIAHSIVRAHGGNISVTSGQEQGTEFTIGLASSPEVSVGDPGR